MLCQLLLYSKVIQFSSVQSLSHARLFETPWTAAHQVSLSFTNSGSLCCYAIYKSLFLFVCFNFMKNTIGNLTGIALNLSVALGSKVIFTILVLPIQEHGIFFHLFMSSVIYFISIL